MKKKVLFITGFLLAIIVIGSGVYYLAVVAPMFRVYEEVRNMPIADIDLRQVNSGIYQGAFGYNQIVYRVEVVVNDHQLTAIKVIKNIDNKYARQGEAIIEQVLKDQSLQVDVISGATTTSKSLLKCIENALRQGM